VGHRWSALTDSEKGDYKLLAEGEAEVKGDYKLLAKGEAAA
jgi:hypothetical protein